jgi:O-antigen ligase
MVFLVRTIGGLGSHDRAAWIWAALYFFALLVVWKSESAAAYITVLILHALTVLLLGNLQFKASLHAWHYAVLALGLLAALAVVLGNLEFVFGVFNRNTSLTGRVPMWGHLFDLYISRRPLGGFGFSAFWYPVEHRITMQQMAGYPDPIVVADNGFLDLLLNTGYVGLALFLLFFASLWWRALRNAWYAAGVYELLPLIVLAFVLIANLTWSLLFENESFFMLIMIALSSMVGGTRDLENPPTAEVNVER